MILELDVGNSRIKWRRLEVDHGQAIDQGTFADHEEMIAGNLTDRRPLMLRMCSVRPARVTDRIRQWAATAWNLELHLAEVTRSCAGVTNQYPELSRMGADRWLAMIAAYNRRPGACVVVDAGTALTIDRIDDTGLHLGGYILPGRKLMAQSLEENTRIRLRRRETRITEPGNDTDAAVLNGILASQVTLLDRVMASTRQQNPDATLYLSGGDAELLAENLPALPLEIVPGLVLDGLAYACPFGTGQAGKSGDRG